MAYDYPLSDEYLYWEGIEAVTATLKRAAGNTAVAITHAVREPLTRQDYQQGQLALRGDEMAWNVPIALLTAAESTNELRAADTITAGAEVWTILKADIVSQGVSKSHWRCLARLNK